MLTALRPNFTTRDREQLLVALAQARRLTSRCSEAERYGSFRYQVCLGMLASIEALADELAEPQTSQKAHRGDAPFGEPS